MIPMTLKTPKHIWRAISVLLLEEAIGLVAVEADWLMESGIIGDNWRGVRRLEHLRDYRLLDCKPWRGSVQTYTSDQRWSFML
jgi:hypothetical protein